MASQPLSRISTYAFRGRDHLPVGSALTTFSAEVVEETIEDCTVIVLVMVLVTGRVLIVELVIVYVTAGSVFVITFVIVGPGWVVVYT